MSIHVYNGINMCSLSDIICKIWVKLALILTGLIIMHSLSDIIERLEGNEFDEGT
jgi:hypothetical protein